jgi:hypothetical protein
MHLAPFDVHVNYVNGEISHKNCFTASGATDVNRSHEMSYKFPQFASLNTGRFLEGKPEGKIPLGRPRRRCVVNIEVDLREIEWDVMDWTDLAQDKVQCML